MHFHRSLIVLACLLLGVVHGDKVTWVVSAQSKHAGGTHFENSWQGPSTATFAITRASANNYDFLANHKECGETARFCLDVWNAYVYFVESSTGDCVLTLNCHGAGYSGLTSWTRPFPIGRSIISRDASSDDRKCGPTDSKSRVFDLRAAEATAERCTNLCLQRPSCVAFSGIFGDWCIGCSSVTLDENHEGAVAYKRNELIEGITATSNSFGYHGEAFKAVDGNSNNGVYVDAPSGVCVHTMGGDSWITLDLHSSHEIDRMEFVGRRGSCAGCYAQSSGWDIHIGNSGTKLDPLCKSSVDVTGGDVSTVTCDSALTGHYITISSSTGMVLCEVDVYGRRNMQSAALFSKNRRCGVATHVSASQSQLTNSPEKCMMYVTSECNNKEFFTWRSTNNACHCVEEPNCENQFVENGLNVYRIQVPTTDFFKAAAPGACLKTEIDDIGMVLGNHPHTIQVRLTFPDTVPSVHQFLLNLGQKKTGAHHWIWNLNTQGAQIGKYNGGTAEQIRNVDISVCTYLTTTFSGSTLKLYCNGVFMAQKNMDFSMNSPMLSIGTVGFGQDFAGCISEVSVFSHEKTAQEVERQGLPAFWDTCRWQTAQDPNPATGTFMGWTCRDNEILTGFGLTALDKDITKIQCCSIGGHSSVISNTCSLIDVGQGVEHESAICGDDQDHKVFTGAYDKRANPDTVDAYTEILAGKCCEVECDAGWCAGKNWGVDKTDCEVVSAQGSVAQELVCPIGTLLTEIHDDLNGFASGIQKVGSVTCCTLHVIAEPTLDPTSSPSRTPSTGPTVSPSKAPTTTEPTVVPSLSPSRTPSAGPSVSPSKAPTTTEPTVAPSLSPSRTPSVAPTVAPTKAPTSIGDCLLQNRATARTDEEYLRGLARCLPSCDEVPKVRRALEGRLLQGGVFY